MASWDDMFRSEGLHDEIMAARAVNQYSDTGEQRTSELLAKFGIRMLQLLSEKDEQGTSSGDSLKVEDLLQFVQNKLSGAKDASDVLSLLSAHPFLSSDRPSTRQEHQIHGFSTLGLHSHQNEPFAATTIGPYSQQGESAAASALEPYFQQRESAPVQDPYLQQGELVVAPSVGSYSQQRSSAVASAPGPYFQQRDSVTASAPGPYFQHRDSATASAPGPYFQQREGLAASARGPYFQQKDSVTASAPGPYFQQRDSVTASARGPYFRQRDSVTASAPGLYFQQRDSVTASARGPYFRQREALAASVPDPHFQKGESLTAPVSDPYSRKREFLTASVPDPHFQKGESLTAPVSGPYSRKREFLTASVPDPHFQKGESLTAPVSDPYSRKREFLTASVPDPHFQKGESLTAPVSDPYFRKGESLAAPVQDSYFQKRELLAAPVSDPYFQKRELLAAPSVGSNSQQRDSADAFSPDPYFQRRESLAASVPDPYFQHRKTLAASSVGSYSQEKKSLDHPDPYSQRRDFLSESTSGLYPHQQHFSISQADGLGQAHHIPSQKKDASLLQLMETIEYDNNTDPLQKEWLKSRFIQYARHIESVGELPHKDGMLSSTSSSTNSQTSHMRNVSRQDRCSDQEHVLAKERRSPIDSQLTEYHHDPSMSERRSPIDSQLTEYHHDPSMTERRSPVDSQLLDNEQSSRGTKRPASKEENSSNNDDNQSSDCTTEKKQKNLDLDYEDVLVKRQSGVWYCLICQEQVSAVGCRNARRHLQRPKHIAKLDQAKESGMAHYGDPEVFKLAGTDKWYCHHCCGIWHGEIRITSHVVSNRHYGNKAKVRNVLDDENKVMNSDYEDVLVKKDSGLWRCLLCHQQVLAKSYTEAVRHLDSPTHGISVRKAKTSGTAYHDEPDVFQFKGATKWYCQICSVIIRDVEQTTAHVISNKHIENKTLMQQGRELGSEDLSVQSAKEWLSMMNVVKPDKSQKEVTKSKAKYYCHICKITSKDYPSLVRHIKGKLHGALSKKARRVNDDPKTPEIEVQRMNYRMAEKEAQLSQLEKQDEGKEKVKKDGETKMKKFPQVPALSYEKKTTQSLQRIPLFCQICQRNVQDQKTLLRHLKGNHSDDTNDTFGNRVPNRNATSQEKPSLPVPPKMYPPTPYRNQERIPLERRLREGMVVKRDCEYDNCVICCQKTKEDTCQDADELCKNKRLFNSLYYSKSLEVLSIFRKLADTSLHLEIFQFVEKIEKQLDNLPCVLCANESLFTNEVVLDMSNQGDPEYKDILFTSDVKAKKRHDRLVTHSRLMRLTETVIKVSNAVQQQNGRTIFEIIQKYENEITLQKMNSTQEACQTKRKNPSSETHSVCMLLQEIVLALRPLKKLQCVKALIYPSGVYPVVNDDKEMEIIDTETTCSTSPLVGAGEQVEDLVQLLQRKRKELENCQSLSVSSSNKKQVAIKISTPGTEIRGSSPVAVIPYKEVEDWMQRLERKKEELENDQYVSVKHNSEEIEVGKTDNPETFPQIRDVAMKDNVKVISNVDSIGSGFKTATNTMTDGNVQNKSKRCLEKNTETTGNVDGNVLNVVETIPTPLNLKASEDQYAIIKEDQPHAQTSCVVSVDDVLPDENNVTMPTSECDSALYNIDNIEEWIVTDQCVESDDEGDLSSCSQ